jgi:hypothetical protein
MEDDELTEEAIITRAIDFSKKDKLLNWDGLLEAI